MRLKKQISLSVEKLRCHWRSCTIIPSSMFQLMLILANVQIVNEFNSFNLENITPPIAPKWKHSETLLDEYYKFKHSCQRIFDGPMCHIKSVKVKTSMFLIWAGPDGKDIYESFNLLPHQTSDIELVMQHFEEFCEPICNFRVQPGSDSSKVFQQQGGTIDTFYNCILKLARLV